jgi:SAM-dependent methyltransferase
MAVEAAAKSGAEQQVLHVGCGPARADKLHAVFHSRAFREVRLDIDPAVKPDIVASMTDMSVVASGSMDALWSSHNVEHLFAHEVAVALGEFCRVLKPTGFALITLPDLQAVARLIADDKLADPAYQSPLGPVSPLDILYGHRGAIARGNVFMAHRTGFTARTLADALVAAGFNFVEVGHGASFDLWASAYKHRPAAGAARVKNPAVVRDVAASAQAVQPAA